MRTFILTRIKLNLMRPVLLALKMADTAIALLLLLSTTSAQNLPDTGVPCRRCDSSTIVKGPVVHNQAKHGGRYYCAKDLRFLWDDGDTSGGRWMIDKEDFNDIM